MSTPALDAYVDKSSMTEYGSINYTVVYQGYAEEDALAIDDINYGYRNYYHILDSDYTVDKTIIGNEEKFVTTWRYELAVYEHGERIIPSIELNASDKTFSTPSLTFQVNNAGSDQDWVVWQNAYYKSHLKVGEKVILLTRVSAHNPSFTDMSGLSPIVPTEEYQNINITWLTKRTFTSKKGKTLNLFTEVSFDKPGEYSFSHTGILGVVDNEDGSQTPYGSDSPTVHFIVE